MILYTFSVTIIYKNRTIFFYFSADDRTDGQIGTDISQNTIGSSNDSNSGSDESDIAA